jgi:hypothetical protein
MNSPFTKLESASFKGVGQRMLPPSNATKYYLVIGGFGIVRRDVFYVAANLAACNDSVLSDIFLSRANLQKYHKNIKYQPGAIRPGYSYIIPKISLQKSRVRFI